MGLKFGTWVSSKALISISSQKVRYKYVLKEKNSIFFCEKLFAQALLDKKFAQALLDKSVPMATPLVTVDRKLFQMMPYIIMLKVRKFHQSTRNRLTLLDPENGFRHFGVSLLISTVLGMPPVGNFVTINIYLFYVLYTNFEPREWPIVTSSRFYLGRSHS